MDFDDDLDNDDFSDDFDSDYDDYDDDFDQAEDLLDETDFLDHDDYADELARVQEILQAEGLEAALGYAKQFSFTEHSSIYSNLATVAERHLENMFSSIRYRVVYTNSPIGEDKLNELGKEGYRLVVMIQQDADGWISYMEKLETTPTTVSMSDSDTKNTPREKNTIADKGKDLPDNM